LLCTHFSFFSKFSDLWKERESVPPPPLPVEVSFFFLHNPLSLPQVSRSFLLGSPLFLLCVHSLCEPFFLVLWSFARSAECPFSTFPILPQCDDDFPFLKLFLSFCKQNDPPLPARLYFPLSPPPGCGSDYTPVFVILLYNPLFISER